MIEKKKTANEMNVIIAKLQYVLNLRMKINYLEMTNII